MSERISVTITAQDGASKTFTAIGNSAQKMGDQVERAGKEGTDGLKTIDTQAKQTERSMTSLADKATLVGAAFGTLLSTAALLGTNYRDQQRQIDGINRTYGDQADAILEITEQIQEYTRFSNDAARESALFATALVDAYGLSADQVGVLIERSADLAQIYGIELPDAMMRVAGAIRGEGEAAERLGLNMSDAAIAARALDAGITNWNVPGALSEAERAAFRFQVFMEDTEQTVGAAADAADNAGGRFRQFVNQVDDAAEAVGGFLGPVGQVAAEMAPLVVALPIAGAGLGRFSTALAGTAVAGRAATLALGPMGGAIAAITLALGAGYLAWNVYNDALNSTATAYDNLAESQHQFRLSGQDEIADNFALAETTIRDFEQTLRDLSGQYTTSSGFINMILPTDDQWNDAVNSMNAALNDARVDQEAYLLWVTQQIAMATAIVNDPALFAANPTIIADTIERINNVDLTRFRVEVEETTGAVTNLTSATTAAGAAASIFAAGFADAATVSDRFVGSLIQAATAAGDVATEAAADIVTMTDATQEWLANGDNILDFWLEYQANLKGAQEEYARLKSEALEAGTPVPAALDDMVTASEAAFESTVRLADALSDAGNELDSVLATYQRIDDLGQRSAASGSIAENLVGTPGEWAVIDDLLAAGVITLDEYNAALEAGYRIQESNVRVQEDLNAMRAAQLPLLASEQAAYEAQIDAISQLPPLEQRRALAMQDSAVQAQIASQYATAYSASLGEIPEEVATNMIVSAAEADPVLKDLLLQFGLIEEGADGTITVNFPDGPTVQESIVALTESIDALVLAITGVPVLHVTADTADAQAAIDEVQADADIWGSTNRQAILTADNSAALAATSAAQTAANAFGATTATATLNVNDAASGVIAGAIGLANAFAGMVSTATIVTRYVTEGAGPTPFAMGGIPGYADGGVLFRGAEAGPELLHFATGGVAPIFNDGLYTAPPGTYVSPASANPGLGGGGLNVTFTGNFYGSNRAELNEWARNDLLPAFRDEMIRHQMAAGVMPS